MARIICRTSEPCGDGMRSITTFDSNWCEHKEDKDYCTKCNEIFRDEYKLTKTQLRKILKINQNVRITGIKIENDKIIISTFLKLKRRK